MFTEKDLQQFKQRDISVETVSQQIENFKTGFPFLPITKAATIGDGIIRCSNFSSENLISSYENALKTQKVLKFVPASGAATRMFKTLFEFLNAKKEGKNISEGDKKVVENFVRQLRHFAFYFELKATLYKNDFKFRNLLEKNDFETIVDYFLTEKGLNYGNLPKGLLLFHRYEDKEFNDEITFSPVEEHFVEAATYSTDNQRVARLHFTVSPEHKAAFEQLISEIKPRLEKQFHINFEISFSEQKLSTDTVAVDMKNEPFRNSDGSILFRPAGHGALIANLNEMDADIVFIKNIDNVCHSRIGNITFEYKKYLGGILVKYQAKIFDYLREMAKNSSESLINEVKNFLEKELCVLLPAEFNNFSQEKKIEYLRNKLNRPIRVCGMVKNEGEPGGGPFWAKNSDGSISLQIAESSQIDTSNSQIFSIFKTATHFNPVDLICGIKDFEGKKFDLLKFVDAQTGFISQKSKDGKDLKAQELPGLWNGAMSNWNTLFVEVPIETFNPVKTVMDLLRNAHQS